MLCNDSLVFLRVSVALVKGQAVISQNRVDIRVAFIFSVVLLLCDLEYVALVVFSILLFFQWHVLLRGF